VTDYKSINVLYIASEAAPLIKVGGLGDVAGSLPKALNNLSASLLHGQTLDVRLVIPFHAKITQTLDTIQLVASFVVPHPQGNIPARAFLTNVEGVPAYLIEGSTILSDQEVYSSDPSLDAQKYIFFSLAALEMARSINWRVDILHANDWHTAVSVYDLKNRRPQDPFFENTKSVLTMHNMPYMGAGAETVLHEFGISGCACPALPEWGRNIPLPLGMFATDQILTVSPNYAKEIMTPAYGCGLQDFLTQRKESVAGILNGLDESKWDPTTDEAIHFNYGPAQLDIRTKNKLALQTEFGLERNKDLPLFILITRMDQQKGVDIAVTGLRMIKDQKWQAILLGTGDPILESACRSLEVEFPQRVRAAIRFDLNLSRRMYAGGDILVIPSRYEPCGLTQMIAMRYGCVPLARATGGLMDTIMDTENADANNGFLFEQVTAEDFAETGSRAIKTFKNQSIWRKLQVNGMKSDFSWKKSALKHAEIYINLLGDNE
jgi:starch synthase